MAESGRRGFEVTRLDPQTHPPALRGARRDRRAGGAARRATRRRDAAGRAQLEAALRAGTRDRQATPLAELIALDVDFHRAIYRLADNPAIEEMIAPQWPHMRRSMATVLAELDYRTSAWAEHETIAANILAGDAKAADSAALAHALRRGTNDGRQTEESGRGGVTDAVIRCVFASIRNDDTIKPKEEPS